MNASFRWALACLVTLAATYWALTALSIVSPVVIGDEYTYAISGIEFNKLDHIRQLMPTVPQLNNFFYLRVLHTMHVTGIPLDDGAKILNIILFLVAACGLAAMVVTQAQRVRYISFFTIMLTMPVANFSAYVMPEIMYTTAFALVCVALLRLAESPTIAVFPFALILIAAMTTIKAHGLIVFAALMTTLAFWMPLTRRMSLGRTAGIWIATGATFAIFTTLASRLLSPRVARTGDVVGDFYWNMMLSTLPTLEHFREMASQATTYIASVLLLFTPSIVALIAFAGQVARAGDGPRDYRRDVWAFLAVFLIITLIYVIIVVSWLISEPDRIHLRYLDFTFLPLFALAWLLASRDQIVDNGTLRWTIALVWAASAAFFVYRMPSLRLITHDAPELFFAYAKPEFGNFGLRSFTPWFVLIIGVCGGIAIVAFRLRWFDAQMAALAATILVSNWNNVHFNKSFSRSLAMYPAIGRVADNICGSGDSDILAVTTRDRLSPMYRVLFGIPRVVPLRTLSETEAMQILEAAPAGICLLTHLKLPTHVATPITASREVILYRALGAPSRDSALQ